MTRNDRRQAAEDDNSCSDARRRLSRLAPDQPIALRARWVFPVDGPPLSPGTVLLADGRIEALSSKQAANAVDLGNMAILPGLINAHTHLEFSALQAPLAGGGSGLAPWIGQVIGWRRQRDMAAARVADSLAPDQRTAVQVGLAESLASGTTSLGEIATGPWPTELLARHPGRSLVFLELLGLAPDRSGPLLESAEQHIQRATSVPGNWLAGLSPHAPYTVSLELVERIGSLATHRGVPIAMHLAETREELELLQNHSGPLVEILQARDSWFPTAVPRATRIADYLQLLIGCPRVLAIHGNYLPADAIALLAQHRDRMSVVYCPRTHAYFGHTPYPLRRLLESGVNVAIGTDSRASNPDLNMLEELRSLRGRHPDLTSAQVLALATRAGGQALGWDTEVGSLAPGKRADLLLVALPARHTGDGHELLFDPESRPAAVCCGGHWQLPQ